MTYKETMNYLKENGKAIGEKQEDNLLAAAVVQAYKFHYAASGDPGGKALLIEAVEKYQEAA
ncbi:MAG: hypothetical protein GY938_05470 [Ketobacter sp.]|nr:hypothetical protein [Ketobacter sp.]